MSKAMMRTFDFAKCALCDVGYDRVLPELFCGVLGWAFGHGSSLCETTATRWWLSVRGVMNVCLYLLEK